MSSTATASTKTQTAQTEQSKSDNKLDMKQLSKFKTNAFNGKSKLQKNKAQELLKDKGVEPEEKDDKQLADIKLKYKRIEIGFKPRKISFAPGASVPSNFIKQHNATLFLQSQKKQLLLNAEFEKIDANFYKTYLANRKQAKLYAKFEARLNNILFIGAGTIAFAGTFYIAASYGLPYILSTLATQAASATSGTAATGAASSIYSAMMSETSAKFVAEVFFGLNPQQLGQATNLMKEVNSSLTGLMANKDIAALVTKVPTDPMALMKIAFNGKNPLLGLKPEDLVQHSIGPDGKLVAAGAEALGLKPFQTSIINLTNFMIDRAVGPLAGSMLRLNPISFQPDTSSIWKTIEGLQGKPGGEDKAKDMLGILKITTPLGELNKDTFDSAYKVYQSGLSVDKLRKDVMSKFNEYSLEINNIIGLMKSPEYENPKFKESYIDKIVNRAKNSTVLRGAFRDRVLGVFGYTPGLPAPTTVTPATLARGAEAAAKTATKAIDDLNFDVSGPISTEALVQTETAAKEAAETAKTYASSASGKMETTMLLFKANTLGKLTPENFLGYTSGVVYDSLANKISTGMKSFYPTGFGTQGPADDDEAKERKAKEDEEYEESIKQLRLSNIEKGVKGDALVKLMRQATINSRPGAELDAKNYSALEYTFLNIQNKTKELYKKGALAEPFLLWGTTTATQLFGEVATYGAKSADGLPIPGLSNFTSYASPMIDMFATYKAGATQMAFYNLTTTLQSSVSKIYQDTYNNYIRQPLMNTDLVKYLNNNIKKKLTNASKKVLGRIYLGAYINGAFNQIVDLVFDTLINLPINLPNQVVTDFQNDFYARNDVYKYMTPQGWKFVTENMKSKDICSMYSHFAKTLAEGGTLGSGKQLASFLAYDSTEVTSNLFQVRMESETPTTTIPGTTTAPASAKANHVFLPTEKGKGVKLEGDTMNEFIERKTHNELLAAVVERQLIEGKPVNITAVAQEMGLSGTVTQDEIDARLAAIKPESKTNEELRDECRKLRVKDAKDLAAEYTKGKTSTEDTMKSNQFIETTMPNYSLFGGAMFYKAQITRSDLEERQAAEDAMMVFIANSEGGDLNEDLYDALKKEALNKPNLRLNLVSFETNKAAAERIQSQMDDLIKERPKENSAWDERMRNYDKVMNDPNAIKNGLELPPELIGLYHQKMLLLQLSKNAYDAATASLSPDLRQSLNINKTKVLDKHVGDLREEVTQLRSLSAAIKNLKPCSSGSVSEADKSAFTASFTAIKDTAAEGLQGVAQALGDGCPSTADRDRGIQDIERRIEQLNAMGSKFKSAKDLEGFDVSQLLLEKTLSGNAAKDLQTSINNLITMNNNFSGILPVFAYALGETQVAHANLLKTTVQPIQATNSENIRTHNTELEEVFNALGVKAGSKDKFDKLKIQDNVSNLEQLKGETPAAYLARVQSAEQAAKHMILVLSLNGAQSQSLRGSLEGGSAGVANMLSAIPAVAAVSPIVKKSPPSYLAKDDFKALRRTEATLIERQERKAEALYTINKHRDTLSGYGVVLTDPLTTEQKAASDELAALLQNFDHSLQADVEQFNSAFTQQLEQSERAHRVTLNNQLDGIETSANTMKIPDDAEARALETIIAHFDYLNPSKREKVGSLSLQHAEMTSLSATRIFLMEGIRQQREGIRNGTVHDTRMIGELQKELEGVVTKFQSTYGANKTDRDSKLADLRTEIQGIWQGKLNTEHETLQAAILVRESNTIAEITTVYTKYTNKYRKDLENVPEEVKRAMEEMESRLTAAQRIKETVVAPPIADLDFDKNQQSLFALQSQQEELVRNSARTTEERREFLRGTNDLLSGIIERERRETEERARAAAEAARISAERAASLAATQTQITAQQELVQAGLLRTTSQLGDIFIVNELHGGRGQEQNIAKRADLTEEQKAIDKEFNRIKDSTVATLEDATTNATELEALAQRITTLNASLEALKTASTEAEDKAAIAIANESIAASRVAAEEIVQQLRTDLALAEATGVEISLYASISRSKDAKTNGDIAVAEIESIRQRLFDAEAVLLGIGETSTVDRKDTEARARAATVAVGILNSKVKPELDTLNDLKLQNKSILKKVQQNVKGLIEEWDAAKLKIQLLRGRKSERYSLSTEESAFLTEYTTPLADGKTKEDYLDERLTQLKTWANSTALPTTIPPVELHAIIDEQADIADANRELTDFEKSAAIGSLRNTISGLEDEIQRNLREKEKLEDYDINKLKSELLTIFPSEASRLETMTKEELRTELRSALDQSLATVRAALASAEALKNKLTNSLQLTTKEIIQVKKMLKEKDEEKHAATAGKAHEVFYKQMRPRVEKFISRHGRRAGKAGDINLDFLGEGKINRAQAIEKFKLEFAIDRYLDTKGIQETDGNASELRKQLRKALDPNCLDCTTATNQVVPDVATLRKELEGPALNIEANYLLSNIFSKTNTEAISIGRKAQSVIFTAADTDVSIETGLLKFANLASEESFAETVAVESFLNSQRTAAQQFIAALIEIEQIPEHAMNELYKAVSATHRLAIEGFLQTSSMYINSARVSVATSIASATRYVGLDKTLAGMIVDKISLSPGVTVEIDKTTAAEGIAGGLGVVGTGAAELLLRQYGAPAVGTLLTTLMGKSVQAGVTTVFDNSVNRYRDQLTGRFVKGVGSKVGAIGPVGLLVTQAYHTYETTRYLTSSLGTAGLGAGAAVGLYFGGAKGAAVGATVGAAVGVGAGIAAGAYIAVQGTAAIVAAAGAGTAAAAAAPFVLGGAVIVGAAVGIVGVAKNLAQYYDNVLSTAETALLKTASQGNETTEQTKQRLLELANRSKGSLDKFIGTPIKSMELSESQQKAFDSINNNDLLKPAIKSLLEGNILTPELKKKIEQNKGDWYTGLTEDELSTVITAVLTNRTAQKGGQRESNPMDMFLERVLFLIYVSKLHLLANSVKMEMVVKLTLIDFAKFLRPLLDIKFASETICIEAFIPFPALKVNEETKTRILESTLALENYKTGDELNLFKLNIPSSGAALSLEAVPVEAVPVAEVEKKVQITDKKQKLSLLYVEELALLKQLEYATYKNVTAELIRDICLEKKYTDCSPKQEDFEQMEEAEQLIQTKYDDKTTEIATLTKEIKASTRQRLQDENADARLFILGRIKKLKDVNELRTRNKSTQAFLETFQTKFKNQVRKLYTQIETKGFLRTTTSWVDPEPGLKDLLTTAYESTMTADEKAFLTRKTSKGGYRRTYKLKRV